MKTGKKPIPCGGIKEVWEKEKMLNELRRSKKKRKSVSIRTGEAKEKKSHPEGVENEEKDPLPKGPG